MQKRKRCLVAFDIDGCLMPVNEPPAARTRQLLHKLQQTATHIVLASGKPCLYLSGLARGLGFPDASLVGENGADIWLRGFMPPGILPTDLDDSEVEALEAIEQSLREDFGDRVFFQPNRVGVTAFPSTGDLSPTDVAARMAQEFPDTIVMYEHIDSVEWTVERFNKGDALRRLARHLEIPMQRTAAVGDGANDVPMLQVAHLAYWVGDPAKAPGDYVRNRDSIDEVIQELIDFAQSPN